MWSDIVLAFVTRLGSTRASSRKVSSMVHGSSRDRFAQKRARRKSRGNTDRITRPAIYLPNSMGRLGSCRVRKKRTGGVPGNRFRMQPCALRDGIGDRAMQSETSE